MFYYGFSVNGTLSECWTETLLIPPWQNNQQAVNQPHKDVTKPANGVAEAAEREGNTETSVTAGISISLADSGSASLPIKCKGTARLQAFKSLQ